MTLSKYRFKIYISILFWLLILAIKLIRYAPFLDSQSIKNYFNTLLIITPLDIVTFSLFYFYIVPNILIKSKSKRINAILIGITHWVCYGFIWVWVYYVTDRIENLNELSLVYKSSFGHTVLQTLYATVLCLSVEWYYRKQYLNKLREENNLANLTLLKAQLNPHFLFNVLNSIHSISSTDTVKTGKSIIMLSDIMRYMLVDSNKEMVPLSKEIEYIKNYLELQELRLFEKQCYTFNVNGNYFDQNIAPLIFISFVENAFKHGKKNIKNAIEIRLDANDKHLKFTCLNILKNESPVDVKLSEEIGLKNVKRRLKLIYGDRHQLIIKNEDNKFQVYLEMYL